MKKLKSLYFRMTIVHYLGMIILPINALVFTQNFIAQIIQILIAFALIFHELDEYKDNKNVVVLKNPKQAKAYLKELKENSG